jgi:acyl dehydratase
MNPLNEYGSGLASLQTLVGKALGVSAWFTITQESVDIFAAVTHDRDPIHNDPRWAIEGPFGGTIAHGFFVLSLLGKFSREIGLPGSTCEQYVALNYGLDRVRFIAPVKVGARIRNHVVLTSIDQKSPEKFVLSTTNSIEVEGSDRPCMIAQLLTMVVRR